MKVIIQIDSSTLDSASKLILKNVEEGDENIPEILLTIDSPGGQLDIYVLKKSLIQALDRL